VNAAASVFPGKGLVGWILRNRAPVRVDSLEANQIGYYQEGFEPDIRSFMGCPIPGGGALCVDSPRQNAFAADGEKRLHLFAVLFAQLQELASRNLQERTLAVYFDALSRLAEMRTSYTGWNAYLGRFLPLLAESAGFSYAAFASLAKDNSRYVVEGEHPAFLTQQGKPAELPVNAGIVGWVLRNGEEVVHEGGESGAGTLLFGKNSRVPEFACSLCLPVSVGKAVCGALCLAGTEPRAFTKELRDFVLLVADDLARLLDSIDLRYRIRALLPQAPRQG
jgi:transcriptional regulator with GAF, ATPase, and Fis domain